MPTVARTLQLAPVAQYLYANAIAKGLVFSNGSVDPNRPITIYMVYKILKKVYDEDNNYPGLQPIADYLYELIQKYAFKAAAIVDGNTGGQIVPPTPGSGTLPTVLDFQVDGSTVIPTGATSVLLDGTSGNPDFRGYNVDFVRNSVPQYTTMPLWDTTYFSFNRTTGLFTLLAVGSASAAAIEGEQFRITPIG